MNVVTPKRFNIDEYHRLIELKFLQESDRIELIRGELIQIVAILDLSVTDENSHAASISSERRKLDRHDGRKFSRKGEGAVFLRMSECFLFILQFQIQYFHTAIQ